VQAATGFDTVAVGQLASLAGVLGALGILVAGLLSDRTGERFSTMVVSIATVGLSYAVMALTLHGQATLFITAYLVWAFATWAVSFGNLMNWPDLLPKHLLAVGCAAINTVSQVGAFMMPYAWGAAQDATGGFQTGLTGLAIGAGLSVLVALMARSEARRLKLQPMPA